MTHKIPIIAIVGRPNVGKSSLFNRLVGKRHAIISKTAGTTRDRIYYRAQLDEFTVVMVDTGGLEYKTEDNIEENVQAQVDLAIADADIIYFVVDAKESLTIEDEKAAKKLRRSNKNIIFIANKIDVKGAEDNVPELFKLGFGEPITISAYHDQNIPELVDETVKSLTKLKFKQPEISEEQKGNINISFIGKPNVGKSSLVNALLGKEKVVVSNIPGTTRDATDTEIEWQDQKFNLIDTAGLRRRGKIERGLEKLSSFRSIDAVERSDIVCLIMDYEEGIRKQDQHISAYALDANKGIILVVNKSDLMEEKESDQSRMINVLRGRFDFIPWAPVVFTSALNKKNIEKILEITKEIYDERFKRIPDDELQLFMKEIVHKHVAPRQGTKIPKFFALAQTGVNPPAFTYWVSDSKAVHFSYRRYLENELRKKYGFTGTSIKIIFAQKKSRKSK